MHLTNSSAIVKLQMCVKVEVCPMQCELTLNQFLSYRYIFIQMVVWSNLDF